MKESACIYALFAELIEKWFTYGELEKLIADIAIKVKPLNLSDIREKRMVSILPASCFCSIVLKYYWVYFIIKQKTALSEHLNLYHTRDGSFLKTVKIICLLLAAALLAGCSAYTASQEADAPAEVSPGVKKVFLSLYNDDNPWSIALANDIIAACTEHGISITVKNANGDKSTQYNDISSLNENEYDPFFEQ